MAIKTRAIDALSWAWLVASCSVPVSTLRGVVGGYTAAPYSDQFYELLWLQRWIAGEASVSELWRLFHDHCLFIPRLFFFADYALADGTNVVLIASSLLLQLATVGVLAAQLFRATVFSGATMRFLLGLSIALLLSATQMENFVWGFQVQFILVFLFAVLAVACLLQHAPHAENGRVWIAMSIACAVMSTWSMANGVLVWPLLIALAVVRQIPRTRIVAIVTVGVVVVGHWQSMRDGSGVPLSGQSPFNLLLFTAMYLGSPLRLLGQDIAGNIGGTALVVGLVLLIAHGIRPGRLSRFQLFHLSVLAFTLMTATITAIGRTSYGPTFALNSRYATCALLFWNSLICLCACAWYRSITAPRPRVAAAVVSAAGIGIALLPAHVRTISETMLDATMKNRGALALIVGVEDPALGALIEPTGNVLRHRAFLKSQGLSVFATPWAGRIGESLDVSPAMTAPTPPSTSDPFLYINPGPPGQIARVETGVRILPADSKAVPFSFGYFSDDAGTIQGTHIPENDSWFGLARRSQTRPIALFSLQGIVARRLSTWHYVGALAALPSACDREAWTTSDTGVLNYALNPTPPIEAGYIRAIEEPGAYLLSPPVAVVTADYVVVPYYVDTAGANARLTVLDSDTGRILVALQTREHGYWANWTVPLRAADSERVSAIQMQIESTGQPNNAHSQVIIGEPRLVPTKTQ